MARLTARMNGELKLISIYLFLLVLRFFASRTWVWVCGYIYLLLIVSFFIWRFSSKEYEY